MKKTLLTLLSLAGMALSASAQTPVTAGDLTYNVYPDEGYAEVTGLSDPNGESAVIPEAISFEGNDYTVTKIADNCFNVDEKLYFYLMDPVELPKTITYIGTASFQGVYIKKINIPSGVTYIGEDAFKYTALEEITYLAENPATAPESAFDCYSVAKLIYNNAAAASINSTTPWSLFTNKEGVDVTGPQPQVIVDNNLRIKIFPDDFHADVIGVANAEPFNGKALVIPAEVTFEGTTYTVTGIGEDCFMNVGMTSVTVPEGITTIADAAFYQCAQLESYTLPASYTEYSDYLFYGCRALKSIAIPEGVTKVGAHCFDAGYTEAGAAETLTLPSTLVEVGESAFNMLANVKSLTVPASVTTMGSYAFANMSGLSTLTIQDGVKVIGDFAFAGCNNVTSLTIPNSVTEINQNAFRSAFKLTDLTLSENLTRIGPAAFSDARELTALVIPESVTHIESSAFEKCGKLQKVTLSPNLTTMQRAIFDKCDAITEVVYLAEKPVDSYQNVFSETVYANAMLTYNGAGKERIETLEPWKYFVNKQVGYDRIVIGNIVYIVSQSENTVQVVGFQNEGYDAELVLPDNIEYDGAQMTVTEILPYAFASCTELTSVTIPTGVKAIGDEALAGCNGITEVTYLSENPVKANDNVFTEVVYENATLNYNADADVDTIKPWSNFKNKHTDHADYNDGYLKYIVYPDFKIAEVIGFVNLDKCKPELSIPAQITYDGADVAVTIIGEEAFADNRTLTSVTIPNSIARIDDRAFAGCINIAEVTYLATEPVEANINVFSTTTYGDATLHCADEAAEAIKSINPWKNFLKTSVGIDSIILDAEAETTVFDLNGNRVDADASTLPAGIYVIVKNSKATKAIVK